MQKSKIIFTDNLLSDLKKYGSQVAIGLATQARDVITDAAKFAIEEFYNDYKPEYYKRHYYNFREKSFAKYYKNPHGNIIYGGVVLTPYNMDNIYQDATQEVFDMVMAGYHGVSSGFISPYTFSATMVMSPSPMEIIKEAKHMFINNIDQYVVNGIDKANKQSYKTLKIN